MCLTKFGSSSCRKLLVYIQADRNMPKQIWKFLLIFWCEKWWQKGSVWNGRRLLLNIQADRNVPNQMWNFFLMFWCKKGLEKGLVWYGKKLLDNIQADHISLEENVKEGQPRSIVSFNSHQFLHKSSFSMSYRINCQTKY